METLTRCYPLCIVARGGDSHRAHKFFRGVISMVHCESRLVLAHGIVDGKPGQSEEVGT
jgi:hypothetical protein